MGLTSALTCPKVNDFYKSNILMKPSIVPMSSLKEEVDLDLDEPWSSF